MMPPGITGQQLNSNKQYAPSYATDPPFSHGIFDTDRETAAARRLWLKISLVAVALVILVIFAILPIYWAALGKSLGNIHNLHGYVVDFDEGQIGQAVTHAFSALHGQEQLSWQVQNPSEFPNGPPDVQAALLDNRCWVAVTVNPNATSNLLAAIDSTDVSYNTSLAISVYLTSARNEAAHRAVISPMVYAILANITQTFDLAFAGQLASRPNLVDLMNRAPSLVTVPANFAVYDLRPFDIPVASAIDFVGLIYLVILAFMLTNQLLAAQAQSGFDRRLTLRSLVVLRLVWPFFLYLIISLMYSLLSLAFGCPFGRYYNAGFVICWMMSWIAMVALGFALESMITIMTIKFMSFFLVLWIISNVSVSYYPIEMLPIVFRYGYAMPFYNVSNTVRAVLFNTKNQIGLNFGVQIAWIAVSCITLPVFQWLDRRRQVQEWSRSQGKEES